MATAAIPTDADFAEVEAGDAGVWSFLVVVEMVAAAFVGDAARMGYAEAPTGDVEGVDAVVAEFAVAPVPMPVPVVMNEVVLIRTLGSGTLPERIIERGGNGRG